MTYEYQVTFVYPYVTLSTTVWSASQDEEEVRDTALRTIESETGFMVETADWVVDFVRTLASN
jgi:hypothetical protein